MPTPSAFRRDIADVQASLVERPIKSEVLVFIIRHRPPTSGERRWIRTANRCCEIQAGRLDSVRRRTRRAHADARIRLGLRNCRRQELFDRIFMLGERIRAVLPQQVQLFQIVLRQIRRQRRRRERLAYPYSRNVFE